MQVGPPPAERPHQADDAVVLAGRYRLQTAIGRGGMADVWAAADTETGRRVAVKVMRVGEQADADRFAAEMTILKRLDHPAIVPLYDSGHTVEDSPYFVMQLVDGESLSTRLREEGPLPEPELVGIACSIAGALAHAHERGVVHRDIKPANILIDRDGRAYLSDFGVARLVDATMVTRTGTTIGTAAYLAPEQLQDSAVGPTADVYALGLVLIEAFTGQRAFRGAGVEAAMARLTRDPAIPEDLPSNWQALLLAMTRRDPDRRPTAAVVEGVLRGRLTPPPLDPDELASRTAPSLPSDELPTLVTPGSDAPSGPWGPPSGDSGATATPPPPPPSGSRHEDALTDGEGPQAAPTSGLRGRPTLTGALIGAIGVLLAIAVVLLVSPFDDDPVRGTRPVDDATRELLEVLAASETLRASDPALSRRLRGLADDVVDAVNDDRWAAAARGISRMAQTLRDGIQAEDVDPVVVTGLVQALEDLLAQVRTEVEAQRAARDGPGG